MDSGNIAALLGGDCFSTQYTGSANHLGWRPLSTATDRAGHRQPPPDGSVTARAALRFSVAGFNLRVIQ
jgi:hypothetical protein